MDGRKLLMGVVGLALGYYVIAHYMGTARPA